MPHSHAHHPFPRRRRGIRPNLPKRHAKGLRRVPLANDSLSFAHGGWQEQEMSGGTRSLRQMDWNELVLDMYAQCACGPWRAQAN